jgi:WD40 repeat protein
MALAAGSRLGPYEVLSPIGAGGMGEVYQARDPRLGREVAVKVLPESLATDPDRLRRFEREARAVAALNHPNILTVYDVGTDADRPYVVTELLEGETLGDRLRRGALPLREAVETAVHVVQGLAAAHAKTIAHRDLKPANVFLTSDGRVKILDFGLARWEGLGPEETTASGATEPGTALGTVGYMSPEQVRGGRGDHRSDIFSFGVVLYEMVSGRHPFRRTTGVETQAAILREEPLALSGLRLPEALERVMLRCLEKRPEDRFHSAHDLALALQSIGPLTPLPQPAAGVPEPGPYPGLRPFTEEQRESFFGREAEVAALWEKLQRRKLLSLIGPSGVGKTSFVRAGLVPARPSGWRCVTATPGRRPFASLARALVPELASDTEALQELVGFDDPEVAVRLVGRWRRRHAGALVVVDQLEELFTLNPPEVQAAFAELLRRLCDEADVHVLVSLRDDFLFACHAHPALAEVFTEVTPLGPLAGESLRRALVEPARREGYRFEDGALVEEMCGAVEGERGALPPLAFCAAKLWERRDREKKLLTRAACEEIGGVAGALAQHAEATLERIGAQRRGIVREIFRNLLTAQGTRAACEREELLSVFPDRRAAEEVLGALVDARLLTSYENEAGEGPEQKGHHRIEIVHESLLKAWPRLVRWQTQDEEGAQLRDQLKQAAHLWQEKGRPSDLLWSGMSYQEFELWRDQVWRRRYPGALTALEEEFAAAMAEQAARRRRRRRAVAAAVVAASLAVAAVTGVLWNRARAEALRAEAGKLLALAKVSLEEDSTAALAYARESLDLHDSHEARRFVLELLWRGPVARILDLEQVARSLGLAELGRIWSPVFSPDGRWCAVPVENLPLLLFDRDGGPTRTLKGPPDTTIGTLGFGPGSDLLVTGGPGASLSLWSVPGLREQRTVPLPSILDGWGPVRGGNIVLFTRTSDGGDQSVQVMDLSGDEPRTRATIPRGALPLAVDSEATRLLVVRPPRHVAVLSLDGTNRLQPLAELPDTNTGGDISRRGDLVVVSDESGQARVWSRSDGGWGLLRTLQGPEPSGGVIALLDEQGRRLSQGGPNSSHVLWDLEAFPDAEPLIFGRPAPSGWRQETFDPSGRWLAAGDHARTTMEFWPVGTPWRRVLPGVGTTFSMTFTPDSRWLVACPFANPVRQWPLKASDGGVGTLTPPEGGCWSVAVHPTGREVLVGTSTGFAGQKKGQVLLYPFSGGAPHRLVESWEGGYVFFVAFDAAGRRAVAVPGGATPGNLKAPESRALLVWDLESGEKHTHSVSHLTDERWLLWLPVFAPDGRLYVGGEGGVRRLTLPSDAGGTVSSETIHAAGFAIPSFSGDGRSLLVVGTKATGGNGPFEDLLLFDPVPGTSRPITTHGTRLNRALLSPSGRVIVTGDHDGVVRVGPVSGEEPHLLLGHQGPVKSLAVSPDELWIASSSDESISIWPMPDVTRPPLHTLPHDELMARLDALTNLRVVRDPSSPTGWSEEIGPFPGWKEVPRW